MQPLDSITFNTAGFTLQGDKANVRVWHSPAGDGVGLYYFAVSPNILSDLTSVDAVRAFYRSQVISAGLGMIEVDTLRVDECVAIRTIFKQPQQPMGMTYLGSLTIPFRDFSYVIKVQCQEYGATGLREAAVLDSLLQSGQIKLDGRTGNQIEGWARDPYDASIETPLARNLAEDERYDAQFPDHPLSRVRSILNPIQASLRVNNAVKSKPKFVYAHR
jgi:hypothetical protein